MIQEEIISALIGLVGALEGHPAAAGTDRTAVEALAFPLLYPEGDAAEAAEAVRREKAAVAPDCARCAAPCGNTADYDMALLRAAPAAVREGKLAVLEALPPIALALYRREAPWPPEAVDFLYKALAWVRYDPAPEQLRALADEAAAVLARLTD